MKATGGGHWRLFNTDTDDGDSGLRRDLRVAVPARQIKPFYQLIVDLATNQVVGLEVLARWDHPVQGMVSPDRFIALAEKEGWLGEITTGLLEQVANDVTAWPVELFFSFNIAASQLKEFVAYVIAQKEWIVSRLPADRIEIELTEYALVTDFDTTREAVQVLHENGSKVVLDDFGAGYTNFRHFRGIQFDRLKIDRELVLDMLVDPRAEICVRSIAELGRVLGIDVVAKGISSPEIAARAQKFGCHLGQGSLYSMPVPANEVSALIEKFTKLISPKIRHGV
jgi:EAL domain-containing protein (putative c-di-GMP-specific phosphodiesterase class I)